MNGTTTSLNTTNLDISDNLIMLTSGLTGAPVNDSGILINRGTSGNMFMGWDESEDKFTVGSTTATSGTKGDIDITVGTLVANIESSSADIDGGSINSTTIGDTTASTGRFTTLESTSNADVGGTLDVSGNFKIHTDKFVVNATTGNTDIVGTLDVTGDTSVTTFDSTGATSLATGSGAVDIASSGAMTTVKGTLNVDEAVTLDTTLDVTGDTSVTTFDSSGATSLATGSGIVDIASSGAMTTVKGTLNVDEAVTLDTTLDVVGDTTMTTTAISSTLDVSGATVIDNTVDVSGNFNIHTDKFQVTATSGNTHTKGTLDVSGATVIGGTLDVKQQIIVDGSMNINDNLFMNNTITETLNYTNVDIPSPQSTTPLSGGWTTTDGITSIVWNASGGTTYGNNGNYGYFTAFNDGQNSSGWLGAHAKYTMTTGVYSATAPLSTTISNIGAVSGDYLEIGSSLAYKLTEYQFMTYGETGGTSLNDKLPKDYYIVGSNDDGTTWDPIQKVNNLYLSADNGIKKYTNLYTISTNTSEITEGTADSIGYRKVTGYSTTTNEYKLYRIVV